MMFHVFDYFLVFLEIFCILTIKMTSFGEPTIVNLTKSYNRQSRIIIHHLVNRLKSFKKSSYLIMISFFHRLLSNVISQPLNTKLSFFF